VKVTALGTGAYSNSGASAASAAQVVATALATPAAPSLAAGIATWSAVTNENNGYSVQLYKDGVAEGTVVSIPNGSPTALTYDFSAAITAGGAGSYTVKVTALGTGAYSNSAASAASAAQVVAATAPTLTTDITNNDTATALEITFTADATYEAAITAVQYGATTLAASDYTVSSGKVTIHAGVLAAGSHTITVTATGYTDAVVTQVVTAAPVYSIGVPQVTVNGLSATVTATITDLQTTTSPATVIFQLMDSTGTTPLQLVAIKSTIQNGQQVTAQFNLPASQSYTVKVLIWDDLTTQISKAAPQTVTLP
jgi:hypothetical protein